MREYIIIDKVSGEVQQKMSWGDDRDFPATFVLTANEEVIISDVKDGVQLADTYDTTSKKFYTLDISDNTLQINDIKQQLIDLDPLLSRIQEDTWVAMGMDETKLPQKWQDVLSQKRTLRIKLNTLVTGGK